MTQTSATAPPAVLPTSLVLHAYRSGLFPMADTRHSHDIFWVEPRRRGILPIDGFHLSHSLARTLKREIFLHSHDLAFEAVIHNCGAAAEGRQESWINASIRDTFVRLHKEGHAHSIETWSQDGHLVGGLYGIKIGAAFFGESMFSRARDASKAAMCHLAARLRAGGYLLLDTQFLTPYLSSFGGIEISKSEYLARLEAALPEKGHWESLQAFEQFRPADATFTPRIMESHTLEEIQSEARVDAFVPPALLAGFGPSGRDIVQLLSQTS